jgi:hypothetical protein
VRLELPEPGVVSLRITGISIRMAHDWRESEADVEQMPQASNVAGGAQQRPPASTTEQPVVVEPVEVEKMRIEGDATPMDTPVLVWAVKMNFHPGPMTALLACTAIWSNVTRPAVAILVVTMVGPEDPGALTRPATSAPVVSEYRPMRTMVEESATTTVPKSSTSSTTGAGEREAPCTSTAGTELTLRLVVTATLPVIWYAPVLT